MTPQRFRKKPVVIEAMRFEDAASASAILKWAAPGVIAHYPNGWLYAEDENAAKGPECLRIRTLEGDHRADLGDWVIKGVKGEFYPCKPDIFEMTYLPETVEV